MKRFVARCGKPQRIYSGRGNNFVGANDEQLKQLNEEEGQNFCARKEIEWNFQPPSAPYFVGAWRRLVQCTKKTLKAVLQNRIVAREALKTALVEAEGKLNSQLITHVSSEAGDIEALTSNHFLLLPANPSYDEADDNERDQLNETMAIVPSALVNFFWKRFAKEYIPSLIERKKWKEKRKNLKEADVALVVEPNQPRGI